MTKANKEFPKITQDQAQAYFFRHADKNQTSSTIPWKEGAKKLQKNKSIMEVARRLADK